MAMTSRDLSSSSVSRLSALRAYGLLMYGMDAALRICWRRAWGGLAAPQVAADDQGALDERPERKVRALLCVTQSLADRPANLQCSVA